MKFNAQAFKKALISGYNNLYNFYREIDKLNVFPVPDGDTGTNMNLTMFNAIKEINNLDSNSISKIAETFARGLIMGARGNSGVILSQIFRGFANGLKGIDIITTAVIKLAFTLSKEVAYKAVMKPVEGTILTVIRETAENLAIVDDELSVSETFAKIVSFSTISLNNTPELLPILKEVGVVDSGGYGLVKIFEGLLVYLETGKIVEQRKKLIKNEDSNITIVGEKKNEEKFGYCTEVIIMLDEKFFKKINVEIIHKNLEKQGGKSIVAVNDEDILKIHTHLLTPGTILNYLQQFGEFINVKIENMTLQVEKHVRTIKHERTLKNKEAIIAVTPSAGIANFFKNDLNIQAVIDGGQSMNPSIDDFLKAIEDVDAKEVYILPNNNNIILVAQQAAKVEKKSKVYVIPSTSIQEGMVATLSFDLSETSKKKVSILKNSLKNVTSLSVSVAAKNAFINGIKITKNDYIGIINKKIVISNTKLQLVIKNILDRSIKSTSEIVTFFFGEDAVKSDIDMIKKYLDENFNVEYEIIEGNQLLYTYLIAVE